MCDANCIKNEIYFLLEYKRVIKGTNTPVQKKRKKKKKRMSAP